MRRVRILLPPSEEKASGGRGRPLSVQADDSLRDRSRAIVFTALDKLLAGDPGAAARALQLPAGVAEDALAANRVAADSATSPALRRYAGVVYQGLDAATLTPAQYRRAQRETLIFSGLLGVLRGGDPAPRYRVPAKAQLPGLGIAGTYWRPILDELMPSLLGRGLVVDLRSSDYSAMWRPAGDTAEQVVTIRVLSVRPNGRRGVISYNSKLAKGRLARALIVRADAGAPARDAEDIRAAWADAGGAGSELHRVDGRVELELFEGS